MKPTAIAALLLGLGLALSAEPPPEAVALLESETIDGQAFPLVVAGRAACIVLAPDSAEVVRIAARDLAADVAAVSGARPQILEAVPDDLRRPRVQVALAPDLAGRWETFRISATRECLRIDGSDARALAFALYEISRRLGVSPWAWWADVPVAKRAELRFSLGDEKADAPAVRYRGVFLNDEGWGLEPWAGATFEPEAGNLGPRTYSRIFELLLRLRANTIWPAMHPGTIPFHRVPGNAAAADAYAIVVGSSHAEPMLRNNVGEWKESHDRYNYLANREGVLGYWEQRVRERTARESLFTLGMRGIHDSPIVGPRDPRERIATLQAIFADQRGLLARHLGGGDAARVAQVFCPYKEVLQDYLDGLQVPDDVTLVWPDDNFGYIRRFASPAERARAGGSGVYYHLSYLGAPMSWLWIDTLPPALIWTEMMRAYEVGARRLWIANVGDLKSTERSMEFFLSLAWHADRTDPGEPARFMHRVAARDFGAASAGRIAGIWGRHVLLATARKPEHLQWNLPLTPYRPTEMTEREILRRLEAYAGLEHDTAEAAAAISPAHRDSFFQLVEYPVLAAAAANERYFRAELSRLLRARGDPRAGETFASTDAAEQRIRRLTFHYNHGVAGGKWRHVMTANGISPREWRRFQPDPGLWPLASSAQDAVRPPPAPTTRTAPAGPPGARTGDFVECDGVVSIHAGNFTGRRDAPGGCGWRSIAGLGRTGSAVTLLPTRGEFPPDAAPRLSYRFHVASGGSATVHVRLLPTFPLVPENGIRLALALDDGALERVRLADGFDPASDAWKQRVLANAASVSVRLAEPVAAGWHTLHLVAVDAGVVVDKLVIDFGGLAPSYDGPDETRVP